MQFDLTPAQRALAGTGARAGARPDRRARRRDRPHRTISLGQCRAAEGGRVLRHDDPGRLWRPKGAESYLDAVLVIEEMAKCCGVTGRIVVEANMGAIGAIMKYGSEAQKRLAAELVLSGDKPAICITEPGAGSAASEMTTRADRRGNGFVVNGKKHWITGGGVSRLHLVFARVFDEQGQGGRDRRLYRDPRRDQGPQDRQRASRRWGCAAFPRPRSSSRTWR